MSEFSSASGPIALLARSYGITERTPDHGELRSTPRLCSSSGRDQHVNARGRTQGTEGQKQSRAAHREMAAYEVSAAFGKSLVQRAPQIDRLQQIIAAHHLGAALKSGVTVGLMRKLVQAEQSQFQAFSQQVSRDSKKAASTGEEAVQALLGLEPVLEPMAFVQAVERPQDEAQAVRFHDGPALNHNQLALKEADFATPPRVEKPVAASSASAERMTREQAVSDLKARHPAIGSNPKLAAVADLLVARVQSERPDLPLDKLVGHPVFAAVRLSGADQRSAPDLANAFFNMNFVKVKG